MRIIFSRKGFDSANGGCASPIFPDGTMYSIPIHGIGEKVTYGQIRKGQMSAGTALGDVVEQLTNHRRTRHDLTHFDPDLDSSAMDRQPGWRPCFGQGSAALSHLYGQGVGPGDVFVFYGWFRRALKTGNGPWTYDPRAPDLHVVFGWLQVAEVLEVTHANREQLRAERPWICDRPHMHVPPDSAIGKNAIYIATDRLTLPGGKESALAGGGEFKQFTDRRVLTTPGSRLRSTWALPAWTASSDNRSPLSYHDDPARWRMRETHVELDTVGRGQEFVLDCAARPEAAGWLTELLK